MILRYFARRRFSREWNRRALNVRTSLAAAVANRVEAEQRNADPSEWGRIAARHWGQLTETLFGSRGRS